VAEVSGARPALFVDRDGTIIREAGYLSDPDDVELLPGAAEGLARFQAAGYLVIIVTNQSGIARGYYSEAEYRAVQAEVVHRLAEAGIRVLDAYHCPHLPEITGPCPCRKPGTELFRKASREHRLDLGRSVFVGDRLRDVAPARELGGIGILVRTGYGREEAAGAGASFLVARDLADAAHLVLDARGAPGVADAGAKPAPGTGVHTGRPRHGKVHEGEDP
jgi:D-glycero-D-manno-heptose 1,7-bisphosphate phosphatase